MHRVIFECETKANVWGVPDKMCQNGLQVLAGVSLTLAALRNLRLTARQLQVPDTDCKINEVYGQCVLFFS